MSTERDARLLDHAWKYFELHAGQRMALFDFFLLFAGFVAAGATALLALNQPMRNVATALGGFLSVLSFVFWKLDQRVCFLMKEAELTIARAEEASFEADDCLFAREPERTAAAKAKGRFLVRLWTYGDSFRLVFWLTGIAGVAAAIVFQLWWPAGVSAD